MRVVLLQTPPCRPDMPALGLPYLQAALKAADIDVTLCDMSFPLYEAADEAEHDYWDPDHHFLWYPPLDGPIADLLERHHELVDRLLEQALGEQPTLVGLTALATQKATALHFAARVKELRPGVPVVVGGASCFPLWEPHAIVRDPAVDYVVVGEGEAAIVDLVRFVADGERGALPAAVLRCRGAGVEAGPQRPLARDLDTLPFPDFSGLPLQRYIDRGRLPLMASRGCIKRCVYCVECRMWERYRHRSADNVFAEIERDVEQHDATKLEFNDSLFNGHPRELRALCDRLIESGLSLMWGGEGVIRKEMTPALLARLHRAGCGHITYGLESASQAVLDRMNKRLDMDVVSRVVRDTSAAGIGQKLNFMVGFPGETETEFQQTLDFLTEHAEHINEINPSDAFTGVLPGSELYERAAEFGVRFVNHHYFWETVDGSNTLKVRLQRFERLLEHAVALGMSTTYHGTRLHNRDFVLAEFHLNREEYKEAIFHFERNAELSGSEPGMLPNHRTAVIKLVAALEGDGRYDEALARLDALEPTQCRPDLALLQTRGRMLTRLGRLDEAREALEQALAADDGPAASIHQALGDCLVDLEDYAAAARHYEHFAEDQGFAPEAVANYVPAVRSLVEALEAGGDHAAALERLDRLGPVEGLDRTTFLEMRGRLLVRLGRLEEARADLERAVDARSEPAPHLHRILADCCLRLQRYAGAARHYERFAEQQGLRPDSVSNYLPTMLSLVNDLEQSGQYEQALEQLARIDPEDRELAATTWQVRGRLLCRLGRLEEARVALERSLALDAEPAPMLVEALGHCCLGLDEFAAAADLYERSAEAQGLLPEQIPNYLSAVCAAAAELETAGQHQAALDRLSDLEPEDTEAAVEVRELRGRLLFHLGKLEQALDSLTGVSFSDGGRMASVWRLRARVLYRLGRLDEAEQALRRASASRPSRPGTTGILTHVEAYLDELLARGQEDEARTYLLAIFDRSTNPSLLFALTWVVRQADRAAWLPALITTMLAAGQEYLNDQSLEQWRAADPRPHPQLEPGQRRDLCEMLLQASRVELAWALALAGSPNPDDVFLTWLRAAALQNRGRTAEALAELDTLGREQNGMTAAIEDTRGSLLCRLGRLDEAEQALQRALDLEPQRVETRCALSYCRFGQGDRPAAEALAREALDRDDNDLARFLLALYRDELDIDEQAAAPPEPRRHLETTSGQRVSFLFLPDAHAAAAARYLESRRGV